jgi:two-component system, chemotaxis family, sensor kinase CheA
VSALQEQFVTEARELIRQATDDLIALERDGASPERIDRVFRAFHTLKGSAGVVELPAMSIMLHAAEDLLAGVRQGTLGGGPDIIDAALACLDLVSRWVDDFDATGALPAQAGEDGRVLAERLRSFLPAEPGQPRPAPAAAPKSTAGIEAGLPEWAASMIAAERDAMASRMPESASALWAISYQPIAGCFYNGDDPLQLMRQVPDLLAFHIEPVGPFAPLSDIDPYACNLSLQAISAGDRDELARIFRLVPDQVQITGIPLDALAVTMPVAHDANQTLIRSVIEAQCELLRVSDRTDDFAGCTGAAARVATNALRHAGQPQLANMVQRAGATAVAQRDAGPLLTALEKALVAFAAVRPAAVAQDSDGPGTGAPPSATERPAERVLRVSEAKIEALVNLAGELVVAKNALAHSARRVEQDFGGHEVARSIRRDHDAIDRLAAELHGTILQLRMVPVAQVFRSLNRLVRDVSRQLGKNVGLVTSGETAEADKTIVDRLFEPLVHLVRNAVDHGIESPGQRRAAGKSETATILIAASTIGDRFLIEVTDDGRGIDPAAVRRKASEKQLVPADELATLTNERVIGLVFAPGFSTAAEVSDISGRGIGMDVVRTVIEQIGGRVSLASRIGTGTTVRLDLPMTIAMYRIMVVEAGGQMFGVSMDAVSETVRITPDRISRIKNNLGFVLRDRVVPIVSLAQLMKLPEREKDAAAARLFVVMETAGKIAALEIDAIRDRLDVVLKPMQGLLENARGYAGTTLLGDGQVLLVLDLKELLP